MLPWRLYITIWTTDNEAFINWRPENPIIWTIISDKRRTLKLNNGLVPARVVPTSLWLRKMIQEFAVINYRNLQVSAEYNRTRSFIIPLFQKYSNTQNAPPGTCITLYICNLCTGFHTNPWSSYHWNKPWSFRPLTPNPSHNHLITHCPA